MDKKRQRMVVVVDRDVVLAAKEKARDKGIFLSTYVETVLSKEIMTND